MRFLVLRTSSSNFDVKVLKVMMEVLSDLVEMYFSPQARQLLFLSTLGFKRLEESIPD